MALRQPSAQSREAFAVGNCLLIGRRCYRISLVCFRLSLDALGLVARGIFICGADQASAYSVSGAQRLQASMAD